MTSVVIRTVRRINVLADSIIVIIVSIVFVSLLSSPAVLAESPFRDRQLFECLPVGVELLYRDRKIVLLQNVGDDIDERVVAEATGIVHRHAGTNAVEEVADTLTHPARDKRIADESGSALVTGQIAFVAGAAILGVRSLASVALILRVIVVRGTREVRGILHRWHPFGEPSVCRESGYHYRCRKKRGQRQPMCTTPSDLPG